MMTNRDADWLLEMANINSEESEPRVIVCRDEIRKEAGKIEIFPHMLSALVAAQRYINRVGEITGTSKDAADVVLAELITRAEALL